MFASKWLHIRSNEQLVSSKGIKTNSSLELVHQYLHSSLWTEPDVMRTFTSVTGIIQDKLCEGVRTLDFSPPDM